MPLFPSEDLKRRFIESKGLDPNQVDIDEASMSFMPRATPVSSTIPGASPSTSPETTANLNQAPKVSQLESLGRGAAESALPTAASLGTMALGAAMFPEPASPILATIGLLLAGAGAGIGTSALQRKVVPESVQQQMFVTPESAENKAATIAGQFLPNVAAFNPVAGLRDIPTLGRGLAKIPQVLGPVGRTALTAAEEQALLNAAMNTVPAAGMDVYQQLQGGQPFDVGQLLGSSLPGALFTRPTGLGKRLGFHDPISDEALARQFPGQPTLDVNAGNVSGPAPRQPSVEELLSAGGVPFERTLPPKKGKLTPQGVAAMEKEQFGLPGLKHRDEPVLEQRAVETMEGEGGPPIKEVETNIPLEEQVQIDRIETEARLRKIEQENQKLYRALGIKGPAPQELPKPINVYDRLHKILESTPPGKEQPKQKELTEIQKFIKDNQRKAETSVAWNEKLKQDYQEFLKGLSAKSGKPENFRLIEQLASPEKITKPIAETPLGKEIYPDYTGNIEEDARQIKIPSKTEAERIQEEYDRGLRESADPQLTKDLGTELRSLPPEKQVELESHLKDQARRRGFIIKESSEILNEAGNPIAGRIDLPSRTIELSKSKAGFETTPHEGAGHGFLNDLLRSGSKTDQALGLKALNAYRGGKGREFKTPEDWFAHVRDNPREAFQAQDSIEETLARDLAIEGTKQAKTSLYGLRRDRLKQWLAGAKSRWKTEFGLQTPEDLRRHMIQRYRGDAPYGTRPELAPSATNTGVRESGEGEKPEVVKLSSSSTKNTLGDPMGTTYRATTEDWDAWQRVQEGMMKLIKEGGDFDSPEMMSLRQENETLKNKYGGMPPQEPVSGAGTRESSTPAIMKGMEEQLQTAAMRASVEKEKTKNKFLDEMDNAGPRKEKPDFSSVKEAYRKAEDKTQELEAFTRPDVERQSEEAQIEKTEIFDYVDEQYIKNEQKSEAGLQLEDVLDGYATFIKKYPYLRKVYVELVRDNHPAINGEAARAITLGNGEGTIYLNEKYWDDALNGKDPEGREQLRKALIHEATHFVQDRENRLDDYRSNPGPAEEEANANMNRYSSEAVLPRASVDEQAQYPSSYGFNRLTTSRLDRIAQKIGTPTAKEVTYKMRQANTERDILEGRVGNRLVAQYEGYSPEEISRVREYRHEIDNDFPAPFSLTPREQKLKAALDKTYKEIGQLVKDSGLQVRAGESFRSMKLRPEGYQENMPSAKVMDAWSNAKPEAAEYDRLFVEHAMKKGQTEKQAEKLLEEYKQAVGNVGITPDVKFGAIRKVEGIGLPWDLVEQNGIASAKRYGRRVAADLAFYKYIQSDPRMLKALGFKDQFGNPYETSPVAKGAKLDDVQYIGSSPEVIAAKRSLLGIDVPSSPVAQSLARVVGANIMQTGTAVRNLAALPSSIAAYPGVNPNSVWNALTKMNSRAARAFENNAIKTSFKDFDAAGEFEGNPSKFIRFADKYVSFMRKWTGRDLSDKLEGLFTYSLGEELATKWFASAKQGDIEARRMLNRFGTTVEGGVKQKFLNRDAPITEDDVARVAKEFVDVARGSYSAGGLPSSAIEGQWAPFLALSRWSIERSNNFYKDAILPIKENGNYAPLLKTAFASLLSGAAIEQLNELLAGKKGQDPSTKEVLLAGRKEDIMAKAIGLVQLGAFGGLVGDTMKFGANIAQGKSTKFSSPLSFPVATLAEDLAQKSSFAAEAIQEGEDPFLVLGEYMKELIRAQSQNSRYALNRLEGEDTARKEKFRDMRVFNELMGDARPGDVGQANPFLKKEEKAFKHEQDLGKAADSLPGLIDKIVAESGGDYEKLKKGLESLKANNYQIFPSLEKVPQTAGQFYEFLKKTQGEEAADARLEEFMVMREKNKVKSQLVPSLR